MDISDNVEKMEKYGVEPRVARTVHPTSTAGLGRTDAVHRLLIVIV